MVKHFPWASFLSLSAFCALGTQAYPSLNDPTQQVLNERLSAQGLLGSHFGTPGQPATFDYVVVVGGGTAGLTVARRLASNYSVAVIEAGSFFELTNGNLSEIPADSFYFLGSDPKSLNPLVDWLQYTTPQEVRLRVLSVRRGRTWLLTCSLGLWRSHRALPVRPHFRLRECAQPDVVPSVRPQRSLAFHALFPSNHRAISSGSAGSYQKWADDVGRRRGRPVLPARESPPILQEERAVQPAHRRGKSLKRQRELQPARLRPGRGPLASLLPQRKRKAPRICISPRSVISDHDEYSGRTQYPPGSHAASHTSAFARSQASPTATCSAGRTPRARSSGPNRRAARPRRRSCARRCCARGSSRTRTHWRGACSSMAPRRSASR